MLTVDKIKQLLNLAPHPEGGYFAETYRAAEKIPQEALPPRYSDGRFHGTAIYYLLTAETCSRFHRVASDEIYHFYLGDPVELWQLYPEGNGERIALGSDLEAGQTLQHVIPHGVWQGSRLITGGRLALLGCTVAPGFDYADFDLADPELLRETYPDFAEIIDALT
jgi:predicted cupin superfamily sugar epimerase